jgi:hypothetical protein
MRLKVVLVVLLFGLVRSGSASSYAQTPTGTPAPESTEYTLVGAGDIAACDSKGDEATAALIDNIPSTVFTAGDNAYPSGTLDEYKRCYEPSWGRFKARTKPAIGNHDFLSGQGRDYLTYFGEGFGKPGASYYSYTLGNWHIVMIDSNISMTMDSIEVRWLKADLAANSTPCTLAIWHHPLFSSGIHGNDARAWPIWKVLYDQHAEIVINGHDHNYERFAPQTPDGKYDAEHGIREFVVGTGGSVLYRRSAFRRNSEAFNNDSYGVLKLTLRPMGYHWEFIPIAGKTFTDSGEGACNS